MKSLTVITALPLTNDKVDQLALKDEDLLVPINVVRSTVLEVLPLTGALGRKLLTPQQTKERFGPWLKMCEFLDRYDIFVSYHKGPQDQELAMAMFTTALISVVAVNCEQWKCFLMEEDCSMVKDLRMTSLNLSLNKFLFSHSMH